ncbi:hypothetical protein ACFU6R_03165 [Streptomyces sp. NPDC057499]|uniref:hypothetical protein n=1 Tax=Streptomyces sp. NPDC057499 TaxID=3346150 RepID=UPI00367F02E3
MRYRHLMTLAPAALLLAGCGLLGSAEKPEPLDVTAVVVDAFPSGATTDRAKGYVEKVEKVDADKIRLTYRGNVPAEGWARYPGDDWEAYIAGLVMAAADEKIGPCHHQVETDGNVYGFGNCPSGYDDPHFG